MFGNLDLSHPWAYVPDLARAAADLLDLSGRETGLRELLELQHIYEDTLILDDPRRRELLPGFAATPLEDAVTETLASYRAEITTSET